MRIALLALLCIAGLPAYAGHLTSKPALFEERQGEVTLAGATLSLTCVTPAHPRSPVYLIVYATGDAGWMGAAGAIVQKMAEQGFYIAAFDAREMVKVSKRSGHLTAIADAAAAVDTIIVQSRRALRLPEATPVIVTGFSRGANLVVFTGGVKSLQHNVAGAVALALTRETDNLQAPDAAIRPPAVQVDAKGRIQTYPAIDLFGAIPIAVIQSNGDSYVPGEEARRLFGPDTPTRRLYQVKASNHGFSGGRDEMLRDLVEALTWIEGLRQTGGGTKGD
jgi:alpha-beta hydrolase superfamily lysophospholipase